MNESGSEESKIYVVKTTVNQERAVANLMAMSAEKRGYDIRAILVPDDLRGYILVEAGSPEDVALSIQGIPHARGIVKGSSSFSEIEHFLTPKPAVAGISEGMIVEIISGPFKGEKAIVKRVDESHEEITVELFESIVPIPVTVRGDHVRVISREIEEK
ncbi:MAG: transcription elongation factor Spt5 [Archaeoglobi archaeon]|nr:transcription elongation factor Spt5 [Candidatus Mnemosynella sp.]